MTEWITLFDGDLKHAKLILRHLFWIKSRKYSQLMLDIDARMPLKIRPIMTFAGNIISPIIFVWEKEAGRESVCMKVDIYAS